MVDPPSDDFLDSDDDEFFLQASNQLLDNDSNLDLTSTRKENASQNLPEVNISSYFKPSVDKQDISDISTKSSNVCKNVDKNASEAVVSSSYDNHSNNDTSFTEYGVDNDDVTFCKISAVSDSSALNKTKTTNKDEAIASTSSDCNTTNVNSTKVATNIDEAIASTSSDCNTTNVNSTKVATPAGSSYINSRFTPGFTPKAKKRKILGPAGFLEFFDGSKETNTDSPDKMLSMDMEFQNIVSSQYTPEHLSLPSWQKLQTTVSSYSNLHSTAKYYSIQRVLLESSKKKMPKHMVVPVLCVLLKKLSTNGTTVSVFMDDTGEINGKIDADVLTKYKELLVEGTALILKKITFLCNVLILKDQNLVSLYHPQGIEKHPQSLESVLETPEPLKPMNCECLKLSHVKKDALKMSHYDIPNHHTSKCVTHSQNRLNSISYKSKTNSSTFQNNSTPNSYKIGFSKPIQNRTKCVTDQNTSASKSPSPNEVSQSMRSDEFLEQLLDEDNDEYDELLGNLDEKSFMESV